MTEITPVEGQLPAVQMDLAEMAADLDIVLGEDGAPDQLRLDVISSTGMLMRELKRRHGVLDPQYLSAELLMKAMVGEARRLCCCWAAGDFQQLPNFHRRLVAVDLLASFGARKGACQRLQRSDVAHVRSFLYEPGMPRVINSLDGKYRYLDQGFVDRLGCEPRDLYGADSIDDMVPIEWRPAARELKHRLLSGEIEGTLVPLPLRARSGSEILWAVASRTTVVRDDLDRPMALGVGTQFSAPPARDTLARLTAYGRQ